MTIYEARYWAGVFVPHALPEQAVEISQVRLDYATARAACPDMTAKGVQVTHRQFDGVDHGFTHTKPTEVAREAITLNGDLLRKAYA